MTTEGEYATRPWWRKEATNKTWNSLPPSHDSLGRHQPLSEENLIRMANIIAKKGTGMAAAKHDGGKPRVHLVWPGLILGMARVLTFGAQKYSEDQWMEGISFRRIASAVYRHFLAILMGEMFDEESGIEHIYHIATNVMFLAYYLENRGSYSKFDDLPYDVTRHTPPDTPEPDLTVTAGGAALADNGRYNRELENFLNPAHKSPDVTVDLAPHYRKELAGEPRFESTRLRLRETAAASGIDEGLSGAANVGER